MRILVDTVASVGTWEAAALTSGLTSISNWNGWTGSVSTEAATVNRVPATVVVTQINDAGALQVDPAWSGNEISPDEFFSAARNPRDPNTAAVMSSTGGDPRSASLVEDPRSGRLTRWCVIPRP